MILIVNVPFEADNILPSSETFSFVLTNEVGQRQYGHCRRFVVSLFVILHVTSEYDVIGWTEHFLIGREKTSSFVWVLMLHFQYSFRLLLDSDSMFLWTSW